MSGHLRNYVMVQRDSLYWLVGPFPTERDAAEWGRLAYPPDADPRWQTIALADPRAIPAVISPSEVPLIALIVLDCAPPEPLTVEPEPQ